MGARGHIYVPRSESRALPGYDLVSERDLTSPGASPNTAVAGFDRGQMLAGRVGRTLRRETAFDDR